MYGNEMINEDEYNPGQYLCRYQTDLVGLETLVNADNEGMAYRMGLDQIEQELGVEITPIYWECQLEAN